MEKDQGYNLSKIELNAKSDSNAKIGKVFCFFAKSSLDERLDRRKRLTYSLARSSLTVQSRAGE